jgi:hypothetical protein
MDNKKNQLDSSGLNIIQNADGSFAFEWDPNDKRWSWLNGLTDGQIKTIIEEAIELKLSLEEAADDLKLS